MAGKTSYRVGVALTVLPVLFLVFDSVIKFSGLPVVSQSMTELGYPVEAAAGIGLLEIACLTVYLIPRTSVLGAVLLTGYLGGAIATHVRVGNPLLSHVLFPTYVAVLLWAGLFLREQRLRMVLPLRAAN
jgi:hypothetical protein